MNYMNQTLRTFFYFILKPILGKKVLQYFFENLYLFSLAGMNYGLVTPKNSGEAYTLKYVNAKLRSTSKIIIFDVGANKGEYVNSIISAMSKQVNIYAFEPLEAACSILKRRFATSKSIKVFNLGFNDKVGKKNIHFNEDTSELASLYQRRAESMSLPALLDKQETVNLSTIDLFCNKNRISHIHLLKIDTEGHELKVLQGAKEMLQQNKISYIQFEFGGAMVDSKTFFRDIYLLLNPNYIIYRILQDGFAKIGNYTEKQEIFIISNYLAVNRKLV